MNTISIDSLKSLSSQLPEKIPYLKMLVLFGSRATGEIHDESDWDFAALYDETARREYIKDNAWRWLEVPSILGDLFNLNSEHIDVVDLSRCQPLIAHSVAVEGKLIYEQETGEFERFQETSTLTTEQRQKIRKELRQKIDDFLREWQVI